jgi:phenylalanyl-tRNA synthetase beta chain
MPVRHIDEYGRNTMKFTLSWLKEFLETDATAAQISERLTALGLEVESLEDRGAELRPFTVAEILEATPHPGADKLRVCTVRAHDGTRQIVCGAPNARTGIKVVLADLGVRIPRDGFTIKKAKIRGVESAGMLCSASELGLGENSDGIMELPESARVGESIVPLLGLEEVLFDIAITPNRGDCLGVYGVARDLAASGMGTLKPLDITAVSGTGGTERRIHLATPDCPFFIGRLIRGVHNGASPDWLNKRLESVGARPISALVDVTNYISLSFGRPLHVYDAGKLHGDVTVRSSRAGEEFAALNDRNYTLPEALCVIADARGVVALGGVIGGAKSACTAETTEVFLESAWFQPEAVMRAGRALSIDSDARYRFERHADSAFVQTGMELATRLILHLCGGEAGLPEIAGATPSSARVIDFAPSDALALGGVDIAPEEARRVLESLGCRVEAPAEDRWAVTPPSFRPDIEGKADLVEELLRMRGYDAVPEIRIPEGHGREETDGAYARARALRGALVLRGMKECQHFAFVSADEAAEFLPEGAAPLRVVNPISADLDALRPTLLPALLGAVRRNQARGYGDLALCEIGIVFSGIAAEEQPIMAAGVRTGRTPPHWSVSSRAYDVHDTRGDLEAALAALGVAPRSVQIMAGAARWYHPGKSGRLLQGKTLLGYFGALHPAILRRYGLDAEALAFECFAAHAPAARAKAERSALRLSDYQATRRDFAFVVADSVPAGEVLSAVRGAEKQLVREVTLFDVYTGKGMATGEKSLALSVTLQAEDRTLTEEEITRVSDAITDAAAKKCGARLR